MTEVWKVAGGRAWQTRYDPATNTNPSHLPLTVSRVHLTDGTPNSRTGRNVRALCGATMWPNRVPEDHPARICAECRRRHEGPLYA